MTMPSWTQFATFVFCFLTYVLLLKIFNNKKGNYAKEDANNGGKDNLIYSLNARKNEVAPKKNNKKDSLKNNTSETLEENKPEDIKSDNNTEDNNLLFPKKAEDNIDNMINPKIVEPGQAKNNNFEVETNKSKEADNKEFKLINNEKINQSEEFNQLKKRIEILEKNFSGEKKSFSETIEGMQKDFSVKIESMQKDILILKRDNNFMKSSYKVLFYRKIANSLLEKMLEKKDNYRNTPFTFVDETKPQEKRKGFSIIIAIKPESKKKRNDINLVIDFLMYVKDYASSVIHISEKSAFYLFSYLDKKNFTNIENDYEKLTINTSQMLSLLFDTKVDDINKKNSQSPQETNKASSIFSSQESINCELLYEKWVESFSTLSYKQKDDFRKFVTFDKEMSIEKLRNTISSVIGETSVEIYKNDAKNFNNMVDYMKNKEIQKFINN